MSIFIEQIGKSVSVAKVRANNTLKNMSNRAEKEYKSEDPDSIELRAKLDELYRLASESKMPKDDSY